MEKTEMMKRYEAETGNESFYVYEDAYTLPTDTYAEEYIEWLEAKANISDEAIEAFQKIIRNQCDEISALKEKAEAYDRLMSMNSLSKNDIKIVLYGKAWCAYRIPFRNQQEEEAGFGVTPQIALIALLKSELPDGWEEKQ